MENQKGHNNKKTKTIILSICALLAVGIGVFLTYSYLNTYTDLVTNTFTVGDGLTAQLDKLAVGGVNGRIQAFVKTDNQHNTLNANTESNTTWYGIEPDENNTFKAIESISGYQSYRTNSNNYRLDPNCVYLKDPTLIIEARPNCLVYAFLKIKNDIANALDISNDIYSINYQLTANQWKSIDFANSSITPIPDDGFSYYFHSPADTIQAIDISEQKTLPIFSQFKTRSSSDNNWGLANSQDIIVQAAVINLSGNPTLQDIWGKLPNKFKNYNS